MNRKFLDELFNDVEIEDTTKKTIIDKIMDKNGEQIEKHNTAVESLKNDIKVQKNLVDELNEKIKQNANIDIEAIKKEQFDLGKAEGNKEVETFKKNNALEKALAGFKAKDIKLLQKLIDNDKIEYEDKDGAINVKGLDNQIEELKKTHDYLFNKEEDPNKRFSTGEKHGDVTPKTEPVDLRGALQERYNK